MPHMMQRFDTSKRNFCFSAGPFKHMALMMVAVLISLWCASPARASDRAFDEYQVKAVFLYRLTLFITWPEEAFTTPEQPFVIGILGDDPLGQKNSKTGPSMSAVIGR